jgi:hypothetical protein
MRLCTSLLLFAALASAEVSKTPFTVAARTSRTAVWVGDRFEYVVRVEYQPELEFVKDHLKKDEIDLQPFEILAAATATGTLPQGGKYLELRLQLTTYATNATEIAIPPITLFYFKQARGPDKEDTPAEAVNIPAFPMAVRDTVIDASLGIRDRRPPLPIDPMSWIVPGMLGVCGLAAIAIGGTRIALAQFRLGVWEQKLAERSRMKSLQQSMEEIRRTPAATPLELASFYDKASEILRGLAAEKLGDGAGLTPNELKQALTAAGDPERHAIVLSELLAQCDLIRYTPDGMERGRRLHSEFLTKLAELTERP